MSAVGEERVAGSAAGDEPTALSEPDQPWHGPASVAGSVVGSLGVLLMVALAGYASASVPDAVHYLLPWTLGLPMLAVRGAVRRFGVGLLASGLLLPAVPAMFSLVAAAFGGH